MLSTVVVGPHIFSNVSWKYATRNTALLDYNITFLRQWFLNILSGRHVILNGILIYIKREKKHKTGPFWLSRHEGPGISSEPRPEYFHETEVPL